MIDISGKLVEIGGDPPEAFIEVAKNQTVRVTGLSRALVARMGAWLYTNVTLSIVPADSGQTP